MEPRRWTFPRRNQWIAGLCEQLVVVQAGEGSGALITAEFMAELGRPIAAVPHRLRDPDTAGGLALLADGAHAIHDVEAFADRVADTHRDDGAAAALPPAWQALLVGGASIDEVSRRTGLPVVELLRELGEALARGEVVAIGGQRYAAGRSPS